MNNARKQILQYLQQELDDAVWQVAFATTRKVQHDQSNEEPKIKARNARVWENVRASNQALSEACADAIATLRARWEADQ